MATELLTIKELAQKLKMNEHTLYNLRAKGLPAIIKKPLRFDFEEVLNWLKSRSDKTAIK